MQQAGGGEPRYVRKYGLDVDAPQLLRVQQ
eukprot:COSAG02_NODE_50754_length_318_cov_1.136986_1_plen_29_part_10